MVGVNPLARQVNFGADVDPITVQIAPGNITGSPIQEKHGYMQNDLYGTSGNQRYSMGYASDYDRFVPQKHEEYKSPLISLALMGGGVIVGAVLLYKVVKGLFFNKKEQKMPEATHVSSRDIRPPEIISIKKFHDTVDSAFKKVDNENISKVNLANFRVLFTSNQDADARREALRKLYDFADIYTQRDRQPKIHIIMPEALQEKANYIVDMFSRNIIDEISPELLDKIKGFQIVNAGKVALGERTDMIVYHQVSHGVNASSVTDVACKWGRNIKEVVRNILN